MRCTEKFHPLDIIFSFPLCPKQDWPRAKYTNIMKSRSRRPCDSTVMKTNALYPAINTSLRAAASQPPCAPWLTQAGEPSRKLSGTGGNHSQALSLSFVQIRVNLHRREKRTRFAWINDDYRRYHQQHHNLLQHSEKDSHQHTGKTMES